MYRLLVLCFLLLVGAQALADSRTVYDTYKNRLVQIRIIDTESNAKSTLGSGFFVTPDGLIVTNYHVVSRLVQHPGQYRAEFIISDGKDPLPAELLDIDVVNDLALLRSGLRDTPFLKVHQGEVRKGTRLYSLGNPHDLGMTIVEGTYNGLIDDSLHKRIHLTGSLNPGMSGGPSINEAGEVVGVNVATAGNQIGFLVPAEYVRRLVADPPAELPDASALLTRLTGQLLANQAKVTATLTARPVPRKQLGTYQVPDSLVPGLNCWGDSSNEEDALYSETSYSCTSKHRIFISDMLVTGTVRYAHYYVSARELSATHFYAIMQQYFTSVGERGHREAVTAWSCETRFVDNQGLPMKAALCLRAYHRIPGLYDLNMNVVSLNQDNAALQSELSLHGFDYDNLTMLARRYLEAITWKKP